MARGESPSRSLKTLSNAKKANGFVPGELPTVPKIIKKIKHGDLETSIFDIFVGFRYLPFLAPKSSTSKGPPKKI